MPFEIVRNDITKMSVDVIVNAANSSLTMGSGVCGAIFKGAGITKLQEECNSIGYCEVGNVVITKGYDLKAKFIIHTVGPIWQGGNNNEAKQLANCYYNALKLASEKQLKTIAFPIISSGIFGYPKARALDIALSTIKEFLKTRDMMVYLVVYDNKAFELSKKLTSSVKKYIDDNYIIRHARKKSISEKRDIKNIKDKKQKYANVTYDRRMPYEKQNRSVDFIDKLEESFSHMLLRLIDEKNLKDSQVYNKANIDRKLFSKIRTNLNYKPKKQTIVALAISLELNLDQTKDLLKKAGYTLSHSLLFDVIVEYFITNGIYDIYKINSVLFSYNQRLLSA